MAEAKCWRFLLWAVNFVVFVVSIALVVFSIWIYTGSEDLIELFGEEYFMKAVIAYLVTGGVVILITFLGCFGAYKGYSWMIIIYIILLSVLIVAEFAAGFLAVYYRYDVKEDVQAWMEKSMNEYKTKDAVRDAWDRFQNRVDCCGVTEAADWLKTDYQQIPMSCCQTETSDNKCNGNNYHTVGCLPTLEEDAKKSLTNILLVGFIITGFQLLNLLIACCAANGLRKETQYV